MLRGPGRRHDSRQGGGGGAGAGGRPRRGWRRCGDAGPAGWGEPGSAFPLASPRCVSPPPPGYPPPLGRPRFPWQVAGQRRPLPAAPADVCPRLGRSLVPAVRGSRRPCPAGRVCGGVRGGCSWSGLSSGAAAQGGQVTDGGWLG